MPKIPHFQCSTWHISPQKIGHSHQSRGSSHCCSPQSLEMSCFAAAWRGKEILPAWCRQIIKQKWTQKHLSPPWCGTADISLLVLQAQTKNHPNKPTNVFFFWTCSGRDLINRGETSGFFFWNRRNWLASRKLSEVDDSCTKKNMNSCSQTNYPQ